MSPKDPYVEDLVPRVVLLGGESLGKVEPSGRSLGHWRHALEGDCGTSRPHPSLFLFLCHSASWLIRWVICSTTHSHHDVLCLPEVQAMGPLHLGLEPPEPWVKISLSFYKLIFFAICYSTTKMTTTISMQASMMNLKLIYEHQCLSPN
jgi:hypothetical protein